MLHQVHLDLKQLGNMVFVIVKGYFREIVKHVTGQVIKILKYSFRFNSEPIQKFVTQYIMFFGT